jgi:hypothetical protein
VHDLVENTRCAACMVDGKLHWSVYWMLVERQLLSILVFEKDLKNGTDCINCVCIM